MANTETFLVYPNCPVPVNLHRLEQASIIPKLIILEQESIVQYVQ